MIAKICGADAELGNFVTGTRRPVPPGEAAVALLGEIPGIPHRSTFASQGRLPLDLETDRERKFLPENGGCVYIDLDHLEICLPEVRSAWDHLACWHAMLRRVRDAQRAANAKLADARLHVLVNNSDGLGASYGSHLDFLVTRAAWDDMFCRKLHPLLFLAAYQASSIVFTGQGKVGSENGAPAVPFQISQRADFIEMLAGPQTTFRRPLVNSRDEPLCGSGSGEVAATTLARLHVICYDSSLSHAAHLLKVGVMQIILAMIEADRTSPALTLDDPVGAIRRWSHDPSLGHRERLAGGGSATAVELQRRFIDEARPLVESGALDEIVPRAGEILALWDDTVTKLEAGDFAALARRLDWVLKLSMLQSVAADRQLSWGAPEMKHLDHLYASLDPHEGLFWAYERSGLIERHVSDADIARFVEWPPDDTRAWGRAMLLRAMGPERITEVDWDFVRVRTGPRGWQTDRIDLADPRDSGRDESAAVECDLGPGPNADSVAGPAIPAMGPGPIADSAGLWKSGGGRGRSVACDAACAAVDATCAAVDVTNAAVQGTRAAVDERGTR